MNKTKIEWCDQTWNPVTGCYHNCPFCYARRITHRYKGFSRHNGIGHAGTPEEPLYNLSSPCFKQRGVLAPYPFDFAPTFHRYRLDEPQRIKKPQNIFVCSMADLFGDWVPDEWIKKVFEACEKAPQHKYLFLTKNPKRYEQFIDVPMPDNMWFGFSQTKREHIGFNTHPDWNVFVSMEPLLEPLSAAQPEGVDWVIVGAETGNRKDKVIPKRDWIENIVCDCRKYNIPVFMKNSLTDIWGEPLIQQYPWEGGKYGC